MQQSKAGLQNSYVYEYSNGRYHRDTVKEKLGKSYDSLELIVQRNGC